MRIRSVKPDFWRDRDTTGRWPADMKLLYVGLWNVADDKGRFELDLDLLAADLDPFRVTWPDLPAVIEKIRLAGCLTVYEVDGRKYGFLPNFNKHQKPNNPSPSKLPEPYAGLPKSFVSAPVVLPSGEEKESRGEGEGVGGEKEGAPPADAWPRLAQFRADLAARMVVDAGWLRLASSERVAEVRDTLEREVARVGVDAAVEAAFAVALREKRKKGRWPQYLALYVGPLSEVFGEPAVEAPQVQGPPSFAAMVQRAAESIASEPFRRDLGALHAEEFGNVLRLTPADPFHAKRMRELYGDALEKLAAEVGVHVELTEAA
jgi:hypothetical protein